MPQNERENTLGQAIEQLVYELGFSFPSQLWDEAGETANRAAWYKRVAPGSKVRTSEKQLTKLIHGLERNGHKLSQEQKDRLYDAIGVKVLKQEELDRARRLEALKDSDRQHLLDSRLARFVRGTRHTEMAEILKLIEQLTSTGGYLTITGRAGEGKTTLVAQLIALHFGREQTAYHIIPFNPGPDHQVTLLHSMMASLALKHPYLSEFWTQNFHRDSLTGTFARMLKDISAKGESEVLFIDGLDQIKPDVGMQERDLNFLPLEVPKGIVIVVSTRPDDTLKPLQLRSPLCEYKLPKLKQADIDQLLAHYAVHLKKEVVEQFYQVTQQNALYVDLLAKELTQLGTETLRPEELLKCVSDNPDNIFSFSIERLKHPDSAWKTVIKPILGLLLATQEPVSATAIGRILTLEDEALQDGLRRLGGLVEEDGQGRYYLYHLKFREYLKEDKNSPDKGYIISQQEVRLRHKQLANWCAGTDPHGGKTIWKDTKDITEQERRAYARQYYIRHLYEAQEWQRLFAVLDEGAYGRAKIDYDPSTRFYAQDLDLGRQAAAWEGWELEEGVEHLPHLWRYTLLRCSLASRADQYPEEAFRLLVLLKQRQKALGLAELLTDPAKKARVLILIAKQLRTQGNQERVWHELLTSAHEIAWSIDSSYAQAKVLYNLVKELLQTQQWDRAEELIQVIRQEDKKADAVCELVKALALAQQWDRSKKAIQTIDDTSVQVRALSVLGEAFALAEHWDRAEKIWARAEQMIFLISDSSAQAKALSALGEAFAQTGQWDRAKALVHVIEKGWWKVKVLSDLIKALAREQQWELAEEIWAEAKEVILTTVKYEASRGEGSPLLAFMINSLTHASEGYGKDEALQNLSTALAQAQQWERAEGLILAIDPGDEKTKALCDLVKALAQAQQWKRAERVIQAIEPRDKSLALCGLGEELVQAEQWAQAEVVWIEIEELVNRSEGDQGKVEVLANLSKVLAQVQQWELAERVIRQNSVKAWALCDWGKTLAQAEQWERAEVIWAEAETLIRTTIEGEGGRALALCNLGKTLAQAEQWERAEVIWTEAETLMRAIAIEETGKRNMALVSLSHIFAEVQQWERAVALSLLIEGDGEIEGLWMCELSAMLVRAQQWKQAETLIHAIKWDHDRAKTLCGLAVGLAQSQQWKRAKEIIHALKGDNEKIEALCELGQALAQAQQWKRADAVWAEIETLIHMMEEGQTKDVALVRLSEALARVQQWGRAREIIDTIKGSNEKVEARCGLGKALILVQQWKQIDTVWAEIELLIRTVDSRSSGTAAALRDLGMALTEVQQWERAEKVIYKIEPTQSERDEALCFLSKTLAQAQQWKRADAIISTIKDNNKKTKALCELGKALTQAQKQERANTVWEGTEELIFSLKNWERTEASKELAEALAATDRYEQLLHTVQRLWLSTETRQDAMRLQPIANSLIPLKSEIGTAFGEAFVWVDAFFRG